MPGAIHWHLFAVERPGRVPGECGACRSSRPGATPWREDHAERVSDCAASLGLLRNGQKAEEHLDTSVWSLPR